MRTLKENLGPEWFKVLSSELDSDWFKSIEQRAAALGEKIRPAAKDVFTAYRSTPPSKVRVVICGQDPYPGNEAHGLSFSSQQKSIPPSLRIIFKELERSGYGVRTNANLQDWADQGVLLLNSVLTTTHRVPNAHKDWGWQKFTGASLQVIRTLPQKIVVMAWGKYAQEVVSQHLTGDSHAGPRMIMSACHPQAENYSGGKMQFVGCGHFENANAFLDSPIQWVDNDNSRVDSTKENQAHVQMSA
jgi:uracil-DNA glycosylase